MKRSEMSSVQKKAFLISSFRMTQNEAGVKIPDAGFQTYIKIVSHWHVLSHSRLRGLLNCKHSYKISQAMSRARSDQKYGLRIGLTSRL